MANSRSALKRVRKTESQSARNRVMKTRVKTHRKTINSLIEDGKAEDARSEFKKFASVADKAGRARVIHPNAVARLKSNLSRRIAALG